MRLATLAIACVILLAACGGGNSAAANGEEDLRARAKPAEANLVIIRDAIIVYYKRNKAAPPSISHLEEVGVTLAKLSGNEDYSELGYAFYSVEFDPEGKLKQGWLIATPMTGRNAYKVRMNGVTGEFDYTPPGQDFGRAPSDPPANK